MWEGVYGRECMGGSVCITMSVCVLICLVHISLTLFTPSAHRYERSLDDNTQLKKRIALLQSEKRSLDQNYRKRIADINNKIMICSSNNELLVLENSELLTNSHILITQLKNERAATKLSKKRSHNKWNVSQGLTISLSVVHVCECSYDIFKTL